MAFNNLKSILSQAGAGVGSGGQSSNGGGVAQAGYQLTSFGSIALGSNPVPISNSNLKFPNKYAMSNVQIQINVTDNTGGSSAPVTPASIESALQNLQIIGTSGKPIFVANGTLGEFERWQQVLNDNQNYAVAPTPADTSTSTDYPVTYNVSLKHLVIDPSESPLTVSILPNTLASRAATLNGMTSSITSVTVSGDFVPVSGYQKTLYRTKQLSDASTGYFDVGQFLDNTFLSSVAADFGADSKLNAANTFYLASNNNTLIPYTAYQNVVNAQNALPANSFGNANHITGFYPFQTLYKAGIDGTQAIKLLCNIASAPTGGGQANTINLYQAETYK